MPKSPNSVAHNLKHVQLLIQKLKVLLKSLFIACSRRSDSAARAKKKASERAGKNEEPRIFPALSLALFFAPAPLSVRLEQASLFMNIRAMSLPFVALRAYALNK